MRIVLGKTAHAHDTVQRPRGLIAVTRPKFRHPERQFAITAQPVVIDLHMTGAVHRLKRINGLFASMFFVDLNDKHMLLVFFPMARRLPQPAIDDLRCVHLDIATGTLTAAHVILQDGIDRPTVGVPKHLSRRFFLHVEQIHLTAQAAMVALGGLFQHGQMGLQIFTVAKRHAIDPLQLLVAAVAAPIGTCD